VWCWMSRRRELL